MSDYIIRPITAADNAKIAKIIRVNLERFHLDIPGAAYFDKELDSLSNYYGAKPEKREYFIVADNGGSVIGTVEVRRAIKQLYTFNHRICYLQATYYANPPQAILSAAGLFCKISIKLQQKLIILCRKFCLPHHRDREEYSNAR